MRKTALHKTGAIASLPKRSDMVVEQIKSWIVDEGLRPGDRLPQEKELIEHFGVSKGTMREALKSLEVQGLIRVSTGPKGGASVASVSLPRSMQLLANYFYFQDLTLPQIYAVRRLLEPELAATVTEHLTEADLHALENSVNLCSHPPADRGMEHQQRLAELDFHDILANACGNEFLAFNCRFMNSLLKNCTVIKKIYGGEAQHVSPARVRKLAADGLHAHQALLEAFRARNPARVRKLMLEHIVAAEQHMVALEAVLVARFMDEQPARRRAAAAE